MKTTICQKVFFKYFILTSLPVFKNQINLKLFEVHRTQNESFTAFKIEMMQKFSLTPSFHFYKWFYI